MTHKAGFVNIIGNPNVGKSTIFNALTNAGAEASNYPFCTIEPNTGVVIVPDPRLDKIAQIVKPKSKTPTTIQFVDIAGLVKGASKGEGLGNQFLGHIRNVDAIALVVRCFEDADVVHVEGSIDPVRDIEVIKTEMILADLETIEKRIAKNEKLLKGQDKKAAKENEILNTMKEELNQGKLAKQMDLSSTDKAHIADLFLLTLKPYFYVGNIDEQGLSQNTPDYASNEGIPVAKICGKIESEIAELDIEDKKAFLKDYHLENSGIEAFIQTGYRLLNLITFFTTRNDELRAWTVEKDVQAPKAAGVIHTDFEKGFIKAEVYTFDDLIKYGTPSAVKEAGQSRIEGREYLVKDGDVILFKFNV